MRAVERTERMTHVPSFERWGSGLAAAEGAAPRRLEDGGAMAAPIHDLADRIASANAIALRRLSAIEPVFVGVRGARDAIPALRERVLLHAGPPITPRALCGPMRGAVLGAAVYEGWAHDLRAAEVLLDQGAIALHSAHDAGAVGPMAGIVSPSMPLVEVRDANHGTCAYAPLNEGIGAVLRFGANDETVIARLRWMRDALAPGLDTAIRDMGGIPLVPMMARALTMGDEMHQRNIAATSLFCRTVAPALAERAAGPGLPAVLRFLAGSDQFFLNVAMAAAKCALESIREIPHCTIVTAMSRNVFPRFHPGRCQPGHGGQRDPGNPGPRRDGHGGFPRGGGVRGAWLGA
jgi:hypothetical protein